jgi:hypothetical protein
MPQSVGDVKRCESRTEVWIALESLFADCFAARTTGKPAILLRTVIFRQFSLSFRRLPL